MTALGISVARTLRRNRKITTTTSTMVISSVISTSAHRGADGLGAVGQDVDLDRRRDVCLQLRAAPSLIRSTVSMTLAPGCLKTISRIALAGRRASGPVLAFPGKTQAPIWLFSTLSSAVPMSLTRIGAPFW